jgi:hypothetical protein
MIIKNDSLILILCLFLVFINAIPQLLNFIYSLENLVISISELVRQIRES